MKVISFRSRRYEIVWPKMTKREIALSFVPLLVMVVSGCAAWTVVTVLWRVIF